jgi:predicted phage tail protein
MTNTKSTRADQPKDPIADRRNFIKLAGATAAGAGATVATAGVATAVAPTASDAQYRETTHVKQYYDSAR